MKQKNIKLVICYDGTNYHGWQIQKNKATIQGIIESKLKFIIGEQIRIIGSGRTDAGVHAISQVANFKTYSEIEPFNLKKALNSLLPEDIYIKNAEYISLDFHARYCAISKTYEYRILNRKEPDIFNRRYQWHIMPYLDIEKMREALYLIIGTHDFSSFKSSGSSVSNPIRTVFKAEISSHDSNSIIKISIEANGFLRHMVRNIVGTIVEVGYGKIDINDFKKIFFSCDRKLAGKKAPASGLFLQKVKY